MGCGASQPGVSTSPLEPVHKKTDIAIAPVAPAVHQEVQSLTKLEEFSEYEVIYNYIRTFFI